ncbi:acetoin reductase family protein [Amylostereum chailletii]|nr:acetoin reductase family protein [Amylostereum chailletii]
MAPARVALVTGAARGIGRSIALQLASDGLDVAVNDVSSNHAALTSLVSEIEAIGRRGVALIADVSDEEQVKTMVEGVVKELGGLDVMVANAGLCELATILDVTVEHYERIFAVNVRGVLLCYKYAAHQMIAQGRGGRIIGATSQAGLQALPSLVAYSASKFAVRGLTQSSAVELAKHGITVNAYAPGGTDTPLFAQFAEGLVGSPDKAVNYATFATSIPMGHVGEPKDIAHAVSFFASEKAGFVTGQTLFSLDV